MANKPYLVLHPSGTLGWLADEAPPENVQDGTLGEHLDSNKRFVYYRGAWHQRGGPPGTDALYPTALVTVPGIGTGSAYAAGDAFGTQFTVAVPAYGRIEEVQFVDRDDEGLAKTVLLFHSGIAQTADNSALSVSAADAVKSLGHIEIEAADFVDMGASREATTRLARGKRYHCPDGLMTVQLQTRGADNIAANMAPLIRFLITPLEAA